MTSCHTVPTITDSCSRRLTRKLFPERVHHLTCVSYRPHPRAAGARRSARPRHPRCAGGERHSGRARHAGETLSCRHMSGQWHHISYGRCRRMTSLGPATLPMWMSYHLLVFAHVRAAIEGLCRIHDVAQSACAALTPGGTTWCDWLRRQSVCPSMWLLMFGTSMSYVMVCDDDLHHRHSRVLRAQGARPVRPASRDCRCAPCDHRHVLAPPSQFYLSNAHT